MIAEHVHETRPPETLPLRMTVEAFDQWALLAENRDRKLEYIGGEMIEVPSNARSSEHGFNVGFFIKLHLRETGTPGHVTGEQAGYRVGGERYAPDIAYMPVSKQPELDEDGYNSVAPDLVVEVVSPSDDPRELATKIANYLAAGIVVWVVYSKPTREVRVFAPGQTVIILGEDDVLDGGTVLPGFKLPVRDIFETR